jgi:hypothetical protein
MIIPETADHEGFVAALALLNQQWVEGTRMLSPALITSLLG